MAGANEPNNGSVDVDVSDLGDDVEPFTAAQQARVNQIVADRVAKVKARAAPAVNAPAAPAKTYTLEELAQLRTALGIEPAPATPRAPVAAAGTVTPNRVDALTSGGLLDIWHMTGADLDRLGPSGVRKAFEQHLEAGRRMSGAPPIPTPKRSR